MSPPCSRPAARPHQPLPKPPLSRVSGQRVYDAIDWLARCRGPGLTR